MRINNLLKRSLLYLLALVLIYPLSSLAFKKFLSIKEPTFISPLSADGDIAIRSDVMGEGHFNARRSGGRRRHKGIDLAGSISDPVVAAKSGIARTGEVKRGMGKYVKIFHLDGYATTYGHLDSIAVNDKDWVWQGQKIGEVGKTGNANYRRMKPHVHFEIKKDGMAQDPFPRITDKSK